VNEKSVLEDELQDLLSQKGELDVRLKDAKEQLNSLQIGLQKENMDKLYQLLGKQTKHTMNYGAKQFYFLF
jgi:ABC-type phosphate transport system auxiliary subunit